LKPVANTKDQVIFLEEFGHIIPKIIPDPVGIGISCSGIITIGEPARENQKTIIAHPVFPVDKIVDVNDVSIHAGT
jgi:hypothetical protein